MKLSCVYYLVEQFLKPKTDLKPRPKMNIPSSFKRKAEEISVNLLAIIRCMRI